MVGNSPVGVEAVSQPQGAVQPASWTDAPSWAPSAITLPIGPSTAASKLATAVTSPASFGQDVRHDLAGLRVDGQMQLAPAELRQNPTLTPLSTLNYLFAINKMSIY